MTADFFQQQDVARRNTAKLVVLFLLAVIAIILAIYLIVAFIYVASQESYGGELMRPAKPVPFWEPRLILWVSLGTITVIALGSLYKIAELSSGGESVALMLGGRLINPRTQDLAERRLLNVVEEMALASGVPVPPVYVLDKEESINAFAAGQTPSNAVIGVSRGALAYLNRDELQGVMGHEFSHILNGDMRLNLRLIGVLNGILVLAILGYYLMRAAGSGSNGNSKNAGGRIGLFFVGLGLLVIGYVGVIFGKLIKAAVSRQREYLADASAVQFTRYAGGIAGALRKIGGLSQGSRIKDAHAEECSHLFFGDAFGGAFAGLLSTHPPLADRIKRIDPSFNGVFPKVAPLPAEADAVAPEAAVQAGGLRAAAQKRPRGPKGKTLALDPTGISGRIGLPGAAQMVFASALLEAMSGPVREASHEPYAARAVVYALLLNREEDVRAKQLADLKSRIEELSYRETEKMAAEVDGMAEEARLPLVDVTLPALKRLSADQYGVFRQTVEALVAADAKIDLFEYVVQAVLLHHLDLQFGRVKPPAIRYHAITPLVPSLGTVLSTLAHAGQDNAADAQRALDQAAVVLGQAVTLLPREECTLPSLDRAMGELAQASPQIKKRVLTAAATCVAADGKVTVKEGELLRVVAALLDCPMPPLAAAVAP